MTGSARLSRSTGSADTKWYSFCSHSHIVLFGLGERKAMDDSRTYYNREAEMRAAREKAALTFVFLLLGLGIGTALALLFAPRPGKEIRHDISHATEGALNQGRDA